MFCHYVTPPTPPASMSKRTRFHEVSCEVYCTTKLLLFCGGGGAAETISHIMSVFLSVCMLHLGS